MSTHPLPTPRSADAQEEPLWGYRCGYCGETWTEDGPDDRCPDCGEREVAVQLFHSCGTCWHTDIADAAQCAEARDEAAYDAHVDRLIDAMPRRRR